jgi:putative methyltransferase (TIGR04325 family)
VTGGVPLDARIRLFVKGFTPPYLWRALKWAKDGLRARGEAEPVLAPPPAEPGQPPEWEYVPEGWARPARGWNADAVAQAYLDSWPSYVEALFGPGPLGIEHGVAIGEPVDRHDRAAHNTIVSYGYVAALAGHRARRLSILDWGGGLGHYEPLTSALLPGVDLEFHCKELPAVVELGRRLSPDVHFHDDESCLERRYDLVLASSSLQYAEDWRHLLLALGEATAGYLFVTRLPVALRASSFVVLQRAYRYGYDTEYLGWVVSREELLREAASARLELVREFLLSAWFSAPGAPEDPVEHRGYLFRSGSSRRHGGGAVGA